MSKMIVDQVKNLVALKKIAMMLRANVRVK
jgi:hypothetical protein